VIAALFGIAGYFNLFPGAEYFTRFDRARGTFQDPNVFGPFLVLPTLLLIQRLLRGPTLRNLHVLAAAEHPALRDLPEFLTRCLGCAAWRP
jgi:hypothetical protein